MAKSINYCVRLDKETLDKLRAAAEKEHRTIPGLIIWLAHMWHDGKLAIKPE